MADLIPMPAKFRTGGGNALTPRAEVQTAETDVIPIPTRLATPDPMAAAAEQYGQAPFNPVQPGQPVPMPEESFAQLRDPFTGELRETPQTEALPEATPLSMTGYTNGLETVQSIAGMLMAANDEGRKKLMENLIPGVRIEPDEKGNQIVTYPDGKQEVLNKPGMTRADWIQLAFDTALYAPAAMATGGVAAPAARAALTGLAAAGTEAVRQQVSQELGTEEPTDLGRVAIAGAGGTLGEYIPSKFKQLRQSGAQKRLGIERELDEGLEEAIRAGEQVDDVTKFGLFRGQITEDLDELGVMNILAEKKGASHIAAKELKAQDKRVHDSTINFLNKYAPEDVVEGAPERFAQAAQDKLDGLKRARTKAAAPLYKKALADKGLYEAPETLAVLDEALAGMAPTSPTATPLRKIQRYITPEEGADGVGLRQLDRAYKDLGDMIETAKRAGKPALVRELQQVKTAFMGEIENITPAYREAVKAWEKNSKPIDRYLKTAPGKISNLDLEDAAKLDGLSSQIFKPTTTVSTLKKSKAIIEAESPQAWRDLTRYHIESRIADMKYDTPAEFYRVLFQQPKQKKLLYAAVDPETARTMRYFEDGLRRAKRGRPGGSRTEPAQERMRTIDGGGVAGAISNLLAPLDSAKKYFGGLSVEARRNQAAKIIFDPRWRSDFKDLRRLAPGSDAAGRKLSRIFQKALRVGRTAAVSQSPESPAATRRALDLLNTDQDQ